MNIEDYIATADAEGIGTPVSVERRESKPNIAHVGAMGRNIYNDIVTNIKDMVPVSGRIHIEINVGIEDKRWFGDNEERKSKLIVDVEMGPKNG